MKRQRRHHSPEFKREAVALVVEHGYSCAAAGRSLGAKGALLGRWKTELEGQAGEAFPGKGHQRQQMAWVSLFAFNNNLLPTNPLSINSMVIQLCCFQTILTRGNFYI